MTIIANTIQTFDRKGLQEDLTDVIYNISPTATPLMSNAGRATAEAVLHEWQTDSLAATDTTNVQIQGNDYTTFAAQAATVRVGNYTTISAKTAIVAGTVENVRKAGRADEMAYQVAKRAKELKRDMESIFFESQAATAGNSSTAAQLAGLLSWVKTNCTFSATDGVSPTWTSGVPTASRTDGTQAAFTETMLKDVMSLCYTSGAEPTTLMVGAFNKQAVSAFTGIATQTYYTSAAKATNIIGAADVYVSDFGTLTVVPNRFQRKRDAWFLDFDFIQVAFLRKFETIKLAKTGDAEKRLLLAEYTLKVDNELAIGGAFDLTTS